jgi:hypothetical protein
MNAHSKKNTNINLQKKKKITIQEKFTQIKRTLVWREVVVNQDMIHGLFSSCIHLGDFTLNACNLKSDLKIISSTLLHLNIVHCQRKMNIDIISSNLSSIDYSYNDKYTTHTMNIKALMLSKFSYKGS